MFIPKPLAKLIAVLRGDVAPLLILISVTLGFWFGLTPGWYGLHVALLVVVLILNVHIGIFTVFAGLGKALSFAAAPLLYHTGVWVQESLTWLVQFLSGMPVIGLTDFARYSVCGALLLGPLLGLAAGAGAAYAVQSFRRGWLRLEEDSDAFKRWRQVWWIRVLDRVLVGKSASDVRSVLTRRPRLVRLAGVGLAAVVLAVAAGGVALMDDGVLTDYAERSLTAANGAEVNLSSVDLDLLSGRVTVEGLQVTDPQRPTHNRVKVGSLAAEISVWSLLRGRVVADKIELSSVEFDQPRTAAGGVLSRSPKAAALTFDPLEFDLSELNPRQLGAYYKDARQVRDWMETLREWLPRTSADAELQTERSVPEHNLEYLTARAATSPSPRVVVRELVLEDVDVPVERIGKATIRCTNLSDAPSSAGEPVVIHVSSQQYRSSLTITSHYEAPLQGAEIEATFEDVDLKVLQRSLSPNNPIVFESGTATASFSGKVSYDLIDLIIRVKTSGMKLRATGAGVFGLDPDITAEAKKVTGVTRVFVHPAGSEVGTVSINTLTREGDVAKAVTSTPHGFVDGNRTTVNNADQAPYNVTNVAMIIVWDNTANESVFYDVFS
ncbi:MAG: hypothetical protein IID33_17220, partial [Planctomycetes bacterium]|nr:hypothetical protein [Planctomycetota bacterium]